MAVLRHRSIAGTRWRITALVRALAFAIAAWSVVPPLAAAQSASTSALVLPSVVRLQQTPCSSAKYEAGELVELLRAELLSLGVERLDVDEPGASAESAAASGLALIHVGCGSVRATLAIDLADLVGGNRVSREVLVDGPPNGRTRALSHAIAQLLESSWSLLATRPTEDAADGGPARLPSSVRSALRRRLSANLSEHTAREASLSRIASDAARSPESAAPAPLLAVRGSLVARAFPSSASAVTGFAVSAAPRLAPLVELAFDLEALYGRQGLRAASGPVDELDTLWLGAGTTLFFATPTQPRFQVGPTLRAAYVHVLTSTEDKRFLARDDGGWVALVGASSLVHFSLTPAWDLFLGADIAYVPGGVSFRTDATNAVRFADLALALRLGASWNR